MELSWKVSGNIEKTTHIIINDDIAHEITITSSLVDQSHTLRF
jgi:hypothetical protein